MRVKVLGIDPSMSNLGLAHCEVDADTLEVFVIDLKLVSTAADSSKTMVKTSDNLRRAREIYEGLIESCKGNSIAMAEIPLIITPFPGQNPAAASLANHGSGISIGVLAACPLPMVQVTPADVKAAAVGSRKAGKDEMIDWAMTRYPNAPWRTRKLRGQQVPTADNEHLADAVAVVHAGVRTAQFRQALSMMRAAQGQ